VTAGKGHCVFAELLAPTDGQFSEIPGGGAWCRITIQPSGAASDPNQLHRGDATPGERGARNTDDRCGVLMVDPGRDVTVFRFLLRPS